LLLGPAPVSCEAKALAYCEPPKVEAKNAGADVAREDDDNRTHWLDCIESHHALLGCLHTLSGAGLIELKESK
jgi:hypothetical protein